ncbi:hypothetical protein [Kozakia baliensis]|uniref:hypothetical protein n=1 Tax=Kozakia baliensis TaxID=153496 RepID=UPI000497B4BD|nr:hypothetical protein [Kozakia baliensis]AOX19895.1 hypothetical protein A0U90_05910 [Kozakia baliensis]
MENPLENSPQREARILVKAKELWAADGKPACGPEGYKEEAADLVGMESNPDAGQKPVESPVPISADGQPIEEAWLEENLGDPGGDMDKLGNKREVPFATRAEEKKALDE